MINIPQEGHFTDKSPKIYISKILLSVGPAKISSNNCPHFAILGANILLLQRDNFSLVL
jgi:hypothetical protein